MWEDIFSDMHRRVMECWGNGVMEVREIQYSNTPVLHYPIGEMTFSAMGKQNRSWFELNREFFYAF